MSMPASPDCRSASVIPTIFGSTSLRNAKLSVPAEVSAARSLPGHRDLEPMLAGRKVSGVDPLHASLLQGLELLEVVDVMRDELAVDLDLHRVEPEGLAFGEGDEDGDLGIGRIEQPFFETTQLGRQCAGRPT